MVLGKFPMPGRPTNLDYSSEGPTALVVGAGGVVWIFFSHLSLLFSLSLSLGDGPTETEILSQRAKKPKPTCSADLQRETELRHPQYDFPLA